MCLRCGATTLSVEDPDLRVPVIVDLWWWREVEQHSCVHSTITIKIANRGSGHTLGLPGRAHPTGMASPQDQNIQDRLQSTPKTVTENIRSVLEMQAALEHRRSLVARIADLIGNFSGSMNFVFIHILWFTAWFLINTGVIHGIKPFDPFPFILLAMVVSVEGVLLSTFVLMKQNRMQHRADIRNQLDLQINLLSEKEVTKALQLLRVICEKLEIDRSVTDDPELVEMSGTTSVDMLAERVETDLEPNE